VTPLYYDLHLHSCLSPCGDEEMAPGNIAGMAALCGLQAVALSDHNTCGNCAPFLAAARAVGLIALPGMELTTREEVHVLCLFPGLPEAEAFAAYVYARLPDIPNDEAVFGPQLFTGDGDAPQGREPRLLLSAADVGLYDTAALVRAHGGLAIPAHIDRPSFSLLANLGFYDPAMNFPVMELSHRADETALRAAHPELEGVRFIRNSDAHRLEDIRDAQNALHVGVPTAEGVLGALGLSKN
jgi:PHP family Zn ribbon phosphoesterase